MRGGDVVLATAIIVTYTLENALIYVYSATKSTRPPVRCRLAVKSICFRRAEKKDPKENKYDGPHPISTPHDQRIRANTLYRLLCVFKKKLNLS